MAKFNQIIAIEKGIKAWVRSEVSALNKAVQKPELFNGYVKNYCKKDEDDEEFPSEKKVQFVTTVSHSPQSGEVCGRFCAM